MLQQNAKWVKHPKVRPSTRSYLSSRRETIKAIYSGFHAENERIALLEFVKLM